MPHNMPWPLTPGQNVLKCLSVKNSVLQPQDKRFALGFEKYYLPRLIGDFALDINCHYLT